jgi:hypothetical protein
MHRLLTQFEHITVIMHVNINLGFMDMNAR